MAEFVRLGCFRKYWGKKNMYVAKMRLVTLIRYLPGVWEALSGDPAMFCDGLHFSSKGSETLAKLIIEYLTKSSPETPFVLPYWRELFDSENQLVLP